MLVLYMLSSIRGSSTAITKALAQGFMVYLALALVMVQLIACFAYVTKKWKLSLGVLYGQQSHRTSYVSSQPKLVSHKPL